jgi:Restriction endonuclease
MRRFDDLSDYDFELLIADLLGEEFRRSFETFPRGPDGGIDLRSRLGETGFHYVQCKHFAESTFAQLKRKAQGEAEALKEAGVKPRRYTYVTSRRLTDANKRALVEVLAPFVRDERDVLGDDDVRALLRRHPAVERGHVKLWIRSSAQLDRILNADVYARSEALIHDILEDLTRYVQTSSFSQAPAKLAKHNVVIIAGPQGVGKTTLARLLLLDAVRAGYTAHRAESVLRSRPEPGRHPERASGLCAELLGRTDGAHWRGHSCRLVLEKA